MSRMLLTHGGSNVVFVRIKRLLEVAISRTLQKPFHTYSVFIVDDCRKFPHLHLIT